MNNVKPIRMVTYKIEVADWNDRYNPDKEVLYCKEVEILSNDDIGKKYSGQGPISCNESNLKSAEMKSVEAVKIRFASIRDRDYDADTKICLNCSFFNHNFNDKRLQQRSHQVFGTIPTGSRCMHQPEPIKRNFNDTDCVYFNNIHRKIEENGTN